MKQENSKKYFQEACQYIPGGVNSPVRAFQSVHRDAPIFAKKAKEAYLWDEDENRYLDYICSWGPMILGHNPEFVLQGVQEAILSGSSFGLPTKGEVELAKLLVKTVPCIETVRLTTSGTEATMSAVRLARAYTKRNKIIKFEGCYHGHSDALLVKSGSGLLTQGFQDSNGIPHSVFEDTVTLPFGEIEQVIPILQSQKIACIIVEPIPANMGVIESQKEFLQSLREETIKYGTLLIFDEVISGFRVALGGAQEYFGITPDLCTLGKIIGGGYPVGAFGGKAEIMKLIAPLGQVYHAGTLSGNPISVRAGYETLSYLIQHEAEIYSSIAQKTDFLVTQIRQLIQKYEIPAVIQSMPSLFTIFFSSKEKITNLEDALTSNLEFFSIYFHTLLEHGILAPPSQFEAHFLSYQHKEDDLQKTLKVMELAFQKIREVMQNE
ncbi:glutamate-1-semialdehyde-2,1-aminomutase [Fusobacterium necrophorum]|uniref:Glutamate-1-semialdehyde 2,1-aminomutase n=1 Tax=Fusobacterium necrophorum TaxID=859 RepID=A0A4Q2KVA6_9FUSO|nr:glutamate-1-semialdehyde 2,1-aminomutase [Fusobacterium necrophorum]RXZ69494.1 glutamate-1-semialdehyde-2,1-aminomutase [Fusobacterium necrophorum]